MLPAVESANSRPAVAPTLDTERATSRTAIGVTLASTMLTGPNSATDATSGFARGPGFQSTTARSTVSSTSGTVSTSAPPSSTVPTSRPGAGHRSARAPPAQ
jgi:hypothetical protein